jgi:hypothetical protein
MADSKVNYWNFVYIASIIAVLALAVMGIISVLNNDISADDMNNMIREKSMKASQLCRERGMIFASYYPVDIDKGYVVCYLQSPCKTYQFEI